MNSIWIKKICSYKHSRRSLNTAKNLIDCKIKRRKILLKNYRRQVFYNTRKDYPKDIQGLLLYEARVAKIFWKEFKEIIPVWTKFKGREPREGDITNRLLDIGYHHLTVKIIKIFQKYDISPALGIIHSAQQSDSAPLAYDLMEMFRADIVDSEVIKFLHQKKKPVSIITEKETAKFVSKLNNRLAHKYYLKNFKQCHTYQYYMELQVLKFIKAVNIKSVFTPIRLPVRHENRC